ncbi:MAG: helix-hairpin-helix domain-containing protein [Bacteroidales bacterium]|jgi:DNA uptake protein ComE-like DNA-binding protein|nr:helix-hairpin-helix domain-containing protein [Bacteroidales bacterium]
MPLKDDLKQYFVFSRSEKYGIIVLCGLILLALVVKTVLPRFVAKESHAADYREEAALFRSSTDDASAGEQERSMLEIAETRSYFYFDPNHATDKEWKQLGLNGRQILNIRNYQSKGGTFRKKEDVKKLYTIPITLYESLAPYIRFRANSNRPLPVAGRPKTTVRTESRSPTIAPLPIELNTADSALMTSLPRIGPILAARVLKYRRLIGGFVRIDQLNEVYDMDSSIVERIRLQVTVDSSLVRKISVNKASFKELNSHPYLNREQTNGILYYRKIQTSVRTLDELVTNNILPPETAQKIAPYLSFE